MTTYVPTTSFRFHQHVRRTWQWDSRNDCWYTQESRGPKTLQQMMDGGLWLDVPFVETIDGPGPMPPP